MKKFKVSVTRTGYRHGYITVEAASKEEALQKAQDRAGDHDFDSEYVADYTANEDNSEEIEDTERARAGHTPGPWEAEQDMRADGTPATTWSVYAPDYGPYAEVGEQQTVADNLSEDDAKLIATAPDMLIQIRQHVQYAQHIETMMRVAEDTKKKITFIKAAGKWAWGDRDEPLNTERLFDTFEEALHDAVDPYLNED